MPKYVYSENIIVFNYRSIINNIGYQITDIGLNLGPHHGDMDGSPFELLEGPFAMYDK